MDRNNSENESLEIKKKINHIGFLDYKEVKKEILKRETITDRLDYLEKIKENYFNKYLVIHKALNEEEKNIIAFNRKEILESIFGNIKLWTSLQIQEPIYIEFFSHLMNKNADYHYWFLKFDAKEKLKAKIISEDYKEMIASNQSEYYIKAELKEITDLQKKANKLKFSTIKNPKEGSGYIIDIEESAQDGIVKWDFIDEKTKLIQILRVLDTSYYKNNIVPQSIGNLPAENYFKHILYKEHLENLLVLDSSQKIIGINEPKELKSEKKFSGKYYALYHWILIDLGIEKPFERNSFNDKLTKTEIIAFAKERYKKSSPDMFYRAYKEINIKDRKLIAYDFGKGYKDIIQDISNNDAKVIIHLKKFPN